MPNPNVLAPLFPKRVDVFWVADVPKLPLAEPKGFLLAASSLGFPPRPLKKPPPRPPVPEPKRPPVVVGCWPKTLVLVLAACPNTEPVLVEPNADAWQKLKPVEDVGAVVVAPPNRVPPCPKLEVCPKAGAPLCPNGPPPLVAAGCPKEKELVVLVLEAAPKTFPLLEVGVAEDTACPKAGEAPKAVWLKVKPLDVFAGWPKARDWPKMGCPNPVVLAVPKVGALNPVVVSWVALADVDAGGAVDWPKREDAVVTAETWPKTGRPEEVVTVSLVGWVNTELEELETGSCANPEGLAVETVKAEVAMAGAGIDALGAEEEGRVLGASKGGEPTPDRPAVGGTSWAGGETAGAASAFAWLLAVAETSVARTPGAASRLTMASASLCKAGGFCGSGACTGVAAARTPASL